MCQVADENVCCSSFMGSWPVRARDRNYRPTSEVERAFSLEQRLTASPDGSSD